MQGDRSTPACAAIADASTVHAELGEVSNSNLVELRTPVQSLQQQLTAHVRASETSTAEHAKELHAVRSEAVEKVSQWKVHSDSLTAECVLLKASLPDQATPLSPEEVVARKRQKAEHDACAAAEGIDSACGNY